MGEDDGSHESGPGELDDSDSGEGSAGKEEGQVVATSRRGANSLRAQTLTAFEEATFPAYPPAVAAEPFALPSGLVDGGAPLSARTWDLALSMANFATGLAQKRTALALAQKRAPAARSSSDDSKRTRRPTAVMRQNVEVARLMGVPGSRQKQV